VPPSRDVGADADREFPRLRDWTQDDPKHPFHPDRHTLPAIPASFEVIIDDLERANPPGLPNRRTTFRTQAGNIERLLNLRSELVIASSLARNHIKFGFSSDSPDMVCETDFGRIGVEATTRARDDLARLHDLLEERLAPGPDVSAILRRTAEVFKVDMSREQDLLAAVVGAIAAGRPGPVSIPDFHIAVDLHYGTGSLPNHRVTWLPLLDQSPYWKGAAREFTTAISNKGVRAFAVPTLAAVDVTRLGDMLHWLMFPPSEEDLTQYLSSDLLGTLKAVALVIAGNLQAAGMACVATYSNPAAADEGYQLLDWFRAATQLTPSLAEQAQA
jgi:hypothetical protein